MKQKANAKQKREAEALRRKEAFSTPQEKRSPPPPAKAAEQKPKAEPRASMPSKSPEEEIREFLDYLDMHDVPASKEEPPARGKKASDSGAIPAINLEEGMPVVSDALDRMHMGLQEMRFSRLKAVKLIHGYGSSGRGGKICIGVRDELARMKQRRQIKDFIPGEEFGPADQASRALADRDRKMTRDPDYGRMNHGITIVIL